MEAILEPIGYVLAGIVGAAVVAYVVGYGGYGIVLILERVGRWLGKP